MPLTVNNKTESKSIEDLIAQLDTPTNLNENATDNNHDNNNRKIIRGKRTTSTSSTGGGEKNGSNAANSGSSSGNGQPPTTYFDPVLQKNIIISKKYSKALRSVKGRGLPKKGGSGGNFTW